MGDLPLMGSDTRLNFRMSAFIGVVLVIAGAAGWATRISLKQDAMAESVQEIRADVRELMQAARGLPAGPTSRARPAITQ